MATLTLLLPTFDRTSATGARDILPRWLARGDRMANVKPGREAALRECFEFVGTSLPVAALTRSLDAKDAATALWLRADPAYAVADAVTARLLASGDLGLSDGDREELARAVQPLFGDAGFPLEPTTPARWYLRCPLGARLPRFAAPEDVLGDDLMQHLPVGDNERQWRHLLNEAQVILHNHPVNARRAQRGQVPVNSLWFWGAGILPQWVRTKYTSVMSEEDVAIALARLAGLSPTAMTLPVDSLLPADGSSERQMLFDLAGIRDPAMLERDVFATLDAALRRRRFTSVHLSFESGERIQIKRAHRWRFWRRPKPVPAR